MAFHQTHAGGWTPRDQAHTGRWLTRLHRSVTHHPQPLAAPIEELKALVEQDPVLRQQAEAMFKEAAQHEHLTPLKEIQIRSFEQFLLCLNGIMTTAPQAYQEVKEQSGASSEPATDKQVTWGPAAHIGCPINALLNWPMATTSGYSFFANALVNQQFCRILNYWAEFLQSPASRSVLVDTAHSMGPHFQVLPWLGSVVKAELVETTRDSLGAGENPTPGRFEDIFLCSPASEDKYQGFRSFDAFFTREFRDGVRPVTAPEDDNVIANACESTPLRLARGVRRQDSFWVKEQPYSLVNLLDFDPLAAQFEGGTIYQAFLSALSYHRWHSPVKGTVRSVKKVSGTYFLSSSHHGFASGHADECQPNLSQPFLTAVATRAIIFIEADNPRIGLMAVVLVGMVEVSSCDVTVREGQRVDKGSQLGMFHFGGSTHCLLFRPGVNLEFTLYGQTAGPQATKNLRVNTALARVV